MAIDTAEERRSAAHVGIYFRGKGVTQNVAKDPQWRRQAAWRYSGIPIEGVDEGVQLDPDYSFVYRPFNRLRAGRGIL